MILQADEANLTQLYAMYYGRYHLIISRQTMEN